MKIVSGILLMFGGLCGAAIGFMGTVQVSSTLKVIDGLEFSFALAGFSIFVFLNGVASLFSSTNQ